MGGEKEIESVEGKKRGIEKVLREGEKIVKGEESMKKKRKKKKK